MPKYFRILVSIFLSLNLVFILLSVIPKRQEQIISFKNPIISSEASAAEPETANNETVLGAFDTKTYNILLLGLDARRGDSRPRCDAIHIFSFSPSSDQLIITSIPRGTHIERKNMASTSAYIANNCSINGISDTISEIEKITGIKVDAYTTVGFSQVLGILRTLNIPTTSTLQYLRNRKYAIGDNQRSHNQAMFFKDSILKYFDYVYNLPKDFRHFLYKSADTNLDFETFEYLIEKFENQKVFQNEGNIILVTKPERNKYVKDIHLETDGSADENNVNDPDYKLYQETIGNYLKNLEVKSQNLLASGNKTQTVNILRVPYLQKLWLQIEDEEARDETQFNLTRTYLQALDDPELKTKILDSYREEIQLFNKSKYIEKLPGLESLIKSQ